MSALPLLWVLSWWVCVIFARKVTLLHNYCDTNVCHPSKSSYDHMNKKKWRHLLEMRENCVGLKRWRLAPCKLPLQTQRRKANEDRTRADKARPTCPWGPGWSWWCITHNSHALLQCSQLQCAVSIQSIILAHGCVFVCLHPDACCLIRAAVHLCKASCLTTMPLVISHLPHVCDTWSLHPYLDAGCRAVVSITDVVHPRQAGLGCEPVKTAVT